MTPDVLMEFLTAQGMGGFLALSLLLLGLMLALPLALLIIGKRLLGLDFRRMSDQRDQEIQTEHHLATEMRLLREKLGEMTEAMWGNRDYTDRKLRDIQSHFDNRNDDIIDLLHKALDNQHKIVVFLVRKLGKSEPVRSGSATEVFLKEDRPV